jgi:hypothetical protein
VDDLALLYSIIAGPDGRDTEVQLCWLLGSSVQKKGPWRAAFR